MSIEPALSRYERRVEWPLIAAALLFLLAYAWPILDPGLAPGLRSTCRTITWLAWAAFAIDYFVRLLLSTDRVRFLARHVLDLLVVVLPLLRPLRLLRLVSLLQVLNRHAGGSLRGKVAIYVSGAASLIILVASLAMLDAERGRAGSNITTFGDALWWATTTVTTVGYGDRFPSTGTGRLIAVGLMLCGIALIGVVTATFASWLIDRVRSVEEESQAATRRDVLRLAHEVAELRRALEPGTPPGT